VLYGDVSACAAQMLRDPDVEHFFTRLIQRVAPKSYTQGAWGRGSVGRGRGHQLIKRLTRHCFLHTAKAEVTICRVFFENFSGDQARGGNSDSDSDSSLRSDGRTLLE